MFKKAIALCLDSTPSALGKKLIHLICPGAKPFEGCHCAKIVYGFWDNNLTVPIKTALAGQPFNKDTYQALFKLADQVFIANGGKVASASPAVVGAVSTKNSDPPNDTPQVAAVRGGGRGRGRGGRGAGAVVDLTEVPPTQTPVRTKLKIIVLRPIQALQTNHIKEVKSIQTYLQRLHGPVPSIGAKVAKLPTVVIH